MNKKLDILEASKRISKHVRETFFSYSPSFSNDLNNHVWFKLENLQHTGSFKVRGAFNKLLNLSVREKDEGVLAASTGNHGAAIAYASKVLGISCTIYVPYNSSASKLDNMRRYGASIEFYGEDCIESETKAREIQKGVTEGDNWALNFFRDHFFDSSHYFDISSERMDQLFRKMDLDYSKSFIMYSRLSI